jgi:hypothetical protein
VDQFLTDVEQRVDQLRSVTPPSGLAVACAVWRRAWLVMLARAAFAAFMMGSCHL